MTISWPGAVTSLILVIIVRLTDNQQRLQNSEMADVRAFLNTPEIVSFPFGKASQKTKLSKCPVLPISSEFKFPKVNLHIMLIFN